MLIGWFPIMWNPIVDAWEFVPVNSHDQSHVEGIPQAWIRWSQHAIGIKKNCSTAAIADSWADEGLVWAGASRNHRDAKKSWDSTPQLSSGWRFGISQFERFLALHDGKADRSCTVYQMMNRRAQRNTGGFGRNGLEIVPGMNGSVPSRLLIWTP